MDERGPRRRRSGLPPTRAHRRANDRRAASRMSRPPRCRWSRLVVGAPSPAVRIRSRREPIADAGRVPPARGASSCETPRSANAVPRDGAGRRVRRKSATRRRARGRAPSPRERGGGADVASRAAGGRDPSTARARSRGSPLDGPSRRADRPARRRATMIDLESEHFERTVRGARPRRREGRRRCSCAPVTRTRRASRRAPRRTARLVERGLMRGVGLERREIAAGRTCPSVPRTRRPARGDACASARGRERTRDAGAARIAAPTPSSARARLRPAQVAARAGLAKPDRSRFVLARRVGRPPARPTGGRAWRASRSVRNSSRTLRRDLVGTWATRRAFESAGGLAHDALGEARRRSRAPSLRVRASADRAPRGRAQGATSSRPSGRQPSPPSRSGGAGARRGRAVRRVVPVAFDRAPGRDARPPRAAGAARDLARSGIGPDEATARTPRDRLAGSSGSRGTRPPKRRPSSLDLRLPAQVPDRPQVRDARAYLEAETAASKPLSRRSPSEAALLDGARRA